MDYIITKKETITSKKDGKEYVKLHLLSPKDGSVLNVFTNKDKYLSLNLEEKLIASRETLYQISEISDIVSVYFDNRGSIVSIS